MPVLDPAVVEANRIAENKVQEEARAAKEAALAAMRVRNANVMCDGIKMAMDSMKIHDAETQLATLLLLKAEIDIRIAETATAVKAATGIGG